MPPWDVLPRWKVAFLPQSSSRMARVRVLLLLVAALFVGFSPGALAHNGENHKSAADAHGGTGSVIAERHAWSPVCPPGSGHVCACDNLSLSDAGAKPALVVRRTVFVVLPRPAEAVASAETHTTPSPHFPPSLARAPPALS